MARKEADLSIFTMASDYDPAHYNWPEKELAALGNGCKATAEIIKKHLEENGAKVKEMHVIEHKGEKKATKKFHSGTDETKTHYHILVKFEPSHGATLEEIAEYIGVLQNAIEKLKPGGYSYYNMLAYLTHIKYEKKIQYEPEDVVTLAGSDYVDYFNDNKERWIKARAIIAKKGGKPLDRLFREAIKKLESGELFYGDLAGIPEYRKLLFEPKYMKLLQRKSESVSEVARLDYDRLRNKIQNGEITTLNEITANDEWKLAYMYNQGDIEIVLQKQKEGLIEQNRAALCSKIENKEITSLSEIIANEYWNLFSESQKKLIGVCCRNNGIPFER